MQPDLASLILSILILGILILEGILGIYLYLSLARQQRNTMTTGNEIARLTEKINKLEARLSNNNPETHQDQGRGTQIPAQFEREYAVLSELWQTLLGLQQAALGLKPVSEQLDPEIPAEKIIELQLRNFGEGLNSLADLLHRNRPFYPREIFEPLVEVMTMADTGAFRVRPSGSGKSAQHDLQAQWDAAMANADGIVILIDRICELIRTRLTA